MLQTWNLYERGELVLLVDTSLNGDFDAEVACKYLKIGLLCTQDSPKLRPSMSTVVKMLTGEMSIEDRKITKPGLISDFMDLKVKNPDEKKGKREEGVSSDSLSSGSNILGNSTMSSEASTVTTATFTAQYDRNTFSSVL